MASLTAATDDGRRLATLFGVVTLHAMLLAAPLFFVQTFAFDWVNHIWFANYVAQHLASDRVVPMFANVVNGVGNPIFVFYGSALYTSLAPLILLFGPDIGMRVAVFSAFLLPNVALAQLAARCLRSPCIATCVTITLSTSIYQLTNIYTRGATTEFFAYQFLLFGLVMLIDAILSLEGSLKSAKTVLGLVSGSIGALSHPPTAYLVVLFLSVPALVFAALQGNAFVPYTRRPVRALVVLSIVTVPLIAWAGLTSSFSSALVLNSIEANAQLHYLPHSIDHWLARLLPWPMDFRVEIEGFNLVSTPYLSAPINLGAVVLLMTVVVSNFDRVDQRANLSWWMSIVFLAALLTSVLLSVLASLPLGALERSVGYDGRDIIGVVHASPASWRHGALGRVQFAYRLVNLTNLTLIFGCLAVIVLTTQRRWTRHANPFLRGERNHVVLIVATVVCVMAACIKVVEVSKEFWLLPRYSDRPLIQAGASPLTGGVVAWVSPDTVRRMQEAVKDTIHPPVTQYGLGAYSMPTLLATYEDDGRFVAKHTPFEPQGAGHAVATASCERPCALMTDLVSSPFFRLSLNDTDVPVSTLRSRGGFVVVLTGEGDHRLEVNLGSRGTQLLAYSTMALVTLFWMTLLLLIGRSLMSISQLRAR